MDRPANEATDGKENRAERRLRKDRVSNNEGRNHPLTTIGAALGWPKGRGGHSPNTSTL